MLKGKFPSYSVCADSAPLFLCTRLPFGKALKRLPVHKTPSPHGQVTLGARIDLWFSLRSQEHFPSVTGKKFTSMFYSHAVFDKHETDRPLKQFVKSLPFAIGVGSDTEKAFSLCLSEFSTRLGSQSLSAL